MKLYYIVFSAMLLASCKTETKQPSVINRTKDTTDHSYIELKEVKGKSTPANSDYTTSDAKTQIERPAKSTINTTLDSRLFYNIWATDPDGPTADFEISAKSFYIADYDGDGDMPYTLNGNKLTVYYNDFIREGTVTYLTKDTLKIKWAKIDAETTYVLFPQ
jgi:hypothetical protein